MIDTFSIRTPDDFHVHLRQGDKLSMPIKACEEGGFKKILIMPNTIPPIATLPTLNKYRQEINLLKQSLEPYFSFKVLPSLTPNFIKHLPKNVLSGKLYPAGVTTNSEDGISEIKALAHVFKLMEKQELVLNIHAENPASFSLNREFDYLKKIEWIIQSFPKLKITIEHISDRRTITFIEKHYKRVAGTITVHHLLLSLDDVIGGSLKPHNFCNPIAKRPEDRQAILEAATSGKPHFFLGTDSAPHPKNEKESACGCAGIFTSPVAMPILIQIFQQQNKLSLLEKFTSEYGSNFYGLPLNQSKINFKKKNWVVPPLYDDVVPFFADQTLNWKQTYE